MREGRAVVAEVRRVENAVRNEEHQRLLRSSVVSGELCHHRAASGTHAEQLAARHWPNVDAKLNGLHEMPERGWNADLMLDENWLREVETCWYLRQLSEHVQR